MRVVFIGKDHLFSMAPFRAIAAAHEIAGVVESGPRGRVNGKARLKMAMRRAVSALRPDTLRGSSIRRRVPYFWLDAASKPALESFIRRCSPDVIAVASLSYLLPQTVLDVPAHGAINLHPSLLPHHHGPFPWLWQYLDDVDSIGVTVHKLDAGQDTGPIVKQVALPLARGADVLHLQAEVAARGAELMVQALNEIGAGTARLVQHSLEGHPKARVVQRDEPLIDWKNWPLERAWHAMRGSYPWLDPRSCPPRLAGGRYRVGRYEIGPCGDEPGHVHRDAHGYYVAHPQGKIRIE